MNNRFEFDKEFEEKLNAVNEAARRYFKIKAEYDEVAEKLHLFLDKQKETDKKLYQLLE